MMDREDSEKKEEDQGCPRTPFRLSQRDQARPKGQEDDQKEKDESMGREREIEMAGIKPKGIRNENRDKGQAKDSLHLRPIWVSLVAP